MTMRDKLELLERRRAESELGGGPARLRAQHEKGKLSARERLDVLLDEGSFVEFDRFVLHRSKDFGLEQQQYYGDGVVTGYARIEEGVVSLGGYADIFLRNTLASGVIPQISAVLGPCAGGAVYSPAITDFIFMVRGVSYMFVTGPNVVKTVTHEEVSKEDLGGAMAHNEKSGVAHFAADDDRACLALIRELLSFVPSNNMED